MTTDTRPFDFSRPPMDPAFIAKLHAEGRKIAAKFEDYIKIMAPADKRCLDPIAAAAYSMESMRAAIRTQYIVCWLLAVKAISNGEVKIGTAIAQQFDLKSLRLGERTSLAGHDKLPTHFVALCQEIEDFYDRIDRLDDQIYGAARNSDQTTAAGGRLQ